MCKDKYYPNLLKIDKISVKMKNRKLVLWIKLLKKSLCENNLNVSAK